MADAILGPILSDVLALSGGRKFTLASAFYSEARLDSTAITAQAADIIVRLDLQSIDEWVSRSIAPDALLRLWRRHPHVDVAVYCSPGAHAKLYVGDAAFLVGSANFTVRGLSGTSDEMLWREASLSARRRIARALGHYKAGMQKLSIEALEEYVEANIANVKRLQQQAKPSKEDSLPRHPRRPPRIGTYEAFLAWLAIQRISAAEEILARAAGRGQLSGHVRMNFYGLRQFLLANPAHTRQLRSVDADLYRLAADGAMERAIKEFVQTEAVDEGGLRVDTWRTYLPERSGGKPKTGGGTIGNLNRMLPLVARHLTRIGK